MLKKEKKNTSGGGEKTNINGKSWEAETSLKSVLINNNFTINENGDVFSDNKEYIGVWGEQRKALNLLKNLGADISVWSKELRPDDMFINLKNKTVYIFEKKYQETAGSADEKPQTCDFKRKQYLRVLSQLNYDVKLIYIFNDWFKRKEYKDMLDYIESVGCAYFFNKIPLNILALPTNSIK